MVTIQDNLLSFQRYTEDDVVYWMGVEKNAMVWYKTEFGDGPTIEAEFIEMRMLDKIPVIYCRTAYGIQWGYLSQFKKRVKKLGI